MRSNELAKIAGVTIKTLRHYHKIGLLAEPGRDDNNYRSYSAHHLARLLRIRRLSTLGLSLEDIGHVLGGDEKAEAALSALDQHLSEQIDRFNHKREMIADLRASRSAPDISPQTTRFYEKFDFMPEKVRQTLREQLVLLELAVGDEHMPLLMRYFDRLTAPDVLETTLAVAQRFYQLGPESSAKEKADLIIENAALSERVKPEFAALSARPPAGRKTAFLFEHILSSMNLQQREVFIGILQHRRGTTTSANPSVIDQFVRDT